MENTNQTSTSSKKLKLDFKDSKYATGRRKRSIAKVWVKKGSGNIHVNGLKMSEYFKRPVHQIIVTRPLEISEVSKNYDVKCSVKGGGLSGQAGAIIVTANGNYTTSFGSQWRFASGTAPTLSTTAGKVDRLDYVVQSSNTIHTIATIDLLGTA